MENARTRVIDLWIRRANLQQELELERILQREIAEATFSCELHDFPEIVARQVKRQISSKPLFDQYIDLKKQEAQLEKRLEFFHQRELTVETVATITKDCEILTSENQQLLEEIDDLTVQIATFSDPEYHQLLAHKQHMNLQQLNKH